MFRIITPKPFSGRWVNKAEQKAKALEEEIKELKKKLAASAAGNQAAVYAPLPAISSQGHRDILTQLPGHGAESNGGSDLNEQRPESTLLATDTDVTFRRIEESIRRLMKSRDVTVIEIR